MTDESKLSGMDPLDIFNPETRHLPPNGTLQAKKQGFPPKNIIVPEKRADKWDRQIDGIVLDLDLTHAKLALAQRKVDALARWTLVRDIIAILIGALMLALISYNTAQLWDWN